MRVALIAALSMFGMLGLGKPTPPPPHILVDYVKPREQLEYVEIYHIHNEGALYPIAIKLEQLLEMRPPDYVRIEGSSFFAIKDLYSALSNTTVDSAVDCSTRDFDARWAIIFHYKDNTKDAIGLGLSSNCVRMLNRKRAIAVSPALLEYVQRNFPFMR